MSGAGVPDAFRLAMDHHQAGRLGEAELAYREVLKDYPNHRAADVQGNLAMVLVQLGRALEAEQICRHALVLDPENAGVYLNLGYTLGELGRPEEAEQCYRRALQINPAMAVVHCNLGNVCKQLGRAEEAERSFREALELAPDYALAHYNLGVLMHELGRADEAMRCYLKAQSCNPDYAEAHVAEASLRLAAGDLIAGWGKQEYRWKVRNAPFRKELSQPVWRGAEDLNHKTILLHAEQGIGDAILCLRYVPLVAARGANVLLEVPWMLVPLVRELRGVGRVIAQGEPLPHFDFHCPLLSLPPAFGTTLESIPHAQSYLSVDADVASEWRHRLAADGKLLVGVCWRGSGGYSRDRERSIDARVLAPLFECRRVKFVSLQKDLSDQELAMLSAAGELTQPGADFATTAQLIAALDLVITVDTAWAHWAGAIGKPVWVLLGKASMWFWMLDGERSPWYSTARLFRQVDAGKWEPVVERVRRELDLVL